MTPHVLVVEDDTALRELISYNLKREGCEVSECDDGEEALILIDERQPHFLLLDWMLPSLSGIEICRRLRRDVSTADLPIMMLTARGDEGDRVRGLDAGADDVLIKPFSMNELVARIKAILRRIRPGLVEHRSRVGDLVIDRTAHRVQRDGRDVSLGPTEFRLLDYLMQFPNRVFSREQLLKELWNSAVYVEARTVDVHIGRLRRALAISGRNDPIRTIRAVGYSLQNDCSSSRAAHGLSAHLVGS